MWGWTFAETDGPVEPVDGADDETRFFAEFGMAWLISILLHLGLILVTVFAVWSYVTKKEEQTIPTAELAENPGAKLSTGQDVQAKSAEQQQEVESREVAKEQAKPSSSLAQSKQVKLVGTSGGGGGQLAPSGTTTGEPAKPKLFGAGGGNAKDIVYVIDASGSLIEVFPLVIDELKRSIQELSPKAGQKFTVIFFQQNEVIEVPPKGLKRATEQNKRDVADWISLSNHNVVPKGATNPIPALEQALKYRPDVVFVLSDNITGRGRYEIDQDRLLSKLKELNSRAGAAINTIQFLHRDPLGTLESIAETHGGDYKFIPAAKLGLD